MSQTEDVSDMENDVSETVVDELKAKEPTEERKQELREEHQGHLVRDTTSKLSMDREVAEGMNAEVEAEVPDLYCFDCGEWVGLSGVDLRGTPRSKADAYYLGGPPEDVREARRTVRRGLEDLAYQVFRDVDRIDSLADAHEFVETQVEQTEPTEKERKEDKNA